MEIWKKIEGYDYFVSDLGSLKDMNGTLLTPYKLRQGYLQIGLSHPSGRSKHLVHRLVAKAFIENFENKDFVNHKNLLKNDNRVDNLEWVTKQENIAHYLASNTRSRILYSDEFKVEVANFDGGMLESVRFYSLPTSTVQRWRKELRAI